MMMTWTGMPNDAAEADELELRRCEDHLVRIGEGLRDAAAGDEEDQRRDDRLHLVAGDQPAVEEAESAGEQHRNVKAAATPT